MFMTSSQSPLFHAVLRALMPGPVLLTDKQGEHDLDLLDRLVGRGKDGAIRVIKTKGAVRPLPGCIFDNDLRGVGNGKALKGYVPISIGSSAIIAAWNVRSDEEGTKRPRTVDRLTRRDVLDSLEVDEVREDLLVCKSGLTGYREYAIVRGSSRSFTADDDQLIFDFDLDYHGVETFVVVPLQTVGDTKSGMRIAVLGLGDKIAGISAVRDARSNGHGKFACISQIPE